MHITYLLIYKEKPWYSLDKLNNSTNNVLNKTEEKLKKLHKE